MLATLYLELHDTHILKAEIQSHPRIVGISLLQGVHAFTGGQSSLHQLLSFCVLPCVPLTHHVVPPLLV